MFLLIKYPIFSTIINVRFLSPFLMNEFVVIKAVDVDFKIVDVSFEIIGRLLFFVVLRSYLKRSFELITSFYG